MYASNCPTLTYASIRCPIETTRSSKLGSRCACPTTSKFAVIGDWVEISTLSRWRKINHNCSNFREEIEGPFTFSSHQEYNSFRRIFLILAVLRVKLSWGDHVSPYHVRLHLGSLLLQPGNGGLQRQFGSRSSGHTKIVEEISIF
ncbi:hypothetical protein J6590_068920 [Homalodisca vitripennis]|nr:hypothetical protein J6590_068920 [Homalodisca vitripennis]